MNERTDRLRSVNHIFSSCPITRCPPQLQRRQTAEPGQERDGGIAAGPLPRGRYCASLSRVIGVGLQIVVGSVLDVPPVS